MRKLGPIQCLEVDTDSRSGSASGQELTFILFHGYGADAYDLKPLADVFHTGHPTHYLFPQGPLEVPIGPGWTGRAWWNIDMAGIQAAAMRGEHRDMTKENPSALPELRKKIFEGIAQLKTPWNQIILGGFSQGAMLATDLCLHAPENPRALVSLSGALINKEEWKTLAPQRAGMPFFMSHGNQDPVLAPKGSAQLETLLTQAGWKGKLVSFNGAHEIPPAVVGNVNEFLKRF